MCIIGVPLDCAPGQACVTAAVLKALPPNPNTLTV